MKIFFDGSIFSLQKLGGISAYWSEFLDYYRRQVDRNSIELTLSLYPRANANGMLVQKLGSIRSSVNVVERSSWQTIGDVCWGGSGSAADSSVIFHSPYFNLPPRRKGRINILSLNDFLYLQQENRGARAQLRCFLQHRAIHRADHLVSISEATKDELLRLYPRVDPKRVTVIPLASSSTFALRRALVKRPSGVDLEPPYLLYVGARGGYKNFANLARALAACGRQCRLLCVGGGSFQPSETEMLRRLGLSEKVQQLSRVDEEGLATIYRGALALAYASTHEGFGIPILEAMSSGCPVFCLAQSSMKEVAGQAALYFSDESCGNLGELLGVVMGETRSPLIENGLHRAKQFSWDQSGRLLFELYARLAANRSQRVI
jgi:glycosyltransferase involved in cell wall biosynthesis